MPTIHIIDSIKIMIYYDDHLPPHFHASYVEFEEVFLIESLETYSGKLPNKQRKKVLKWAREHQDFLWARWNEFNPNT